MKIDAHAHIIPQRFYEAAARQPGATIRSWGKRSKIIERNGVRFVGYDEAWFPSEYSLRDMDKKGFDMRLISITPALPMFERAEQIELAKIVNDETIELCRKQPDRFRALPSLPLGDVDASIRELDRVASAKEVAGIAMGSNAAGVPMSDPRFEPLWARIDELRIPVVEHPMHPKFNADMQDLNLSILVGFMFDTQLMVIRLILNGVFERYPNFPFLVAHTGAGLLDIKHRMRGAHNRNPESSKHMKKPFDEYLKGLYFDTCMNDHEVLMDAYHFMGPDRLMWGTDYPFVDNTTAPIENMEIAAKEQAAIIGGNAQRIFKLN
jgi:aminocarboxymuconate-semialdehyde decarboxylase